MTLLVPAGTSTASSPGTGWALPSASSETDTRAAVGPGFSNTRSSSVASSAWPAPRAHPVARARAPGAEPNPSRVLGAIPSMLRSTTTSTPFVLRAVTAWPTPFGMRVSSLAITLVRDSRGTVIRRGSASPSSRSMASSTSASTVCGL